MDTDRALLGLMPNRCLCRIEHATVLPASCLASASIATQPDMTMTGEVELLSIHEHIGVAGDGKTQMHIWTYLSMGTGPSSLA